MERTIHVIEGLQEQSEAGVPIIVEGRRDEAALRRLGIKGTVLCLKATGETRYRFLERLDGSKKAILLTDFDREGGELRMWLHHELSHRGVHVDNEVWRKLHGLSRTEVRSVEELPSFVRALEIRSLGLRP
ncbi:MAG TPA: toprim domain-containing protein [Candidatus Bathyarchaeia archaeon]|jgi:5S rRNA maturation endonuclease (ribonuclease M5)|nr:toprim domain-containing protein [Candidatus Bathyarchaeia archaeon]